MRQSSIVWIKPDKQAWYEMNASDILQDFFC